VDSVQDCSHSRVLHTALLRLICAVLRTEQLRPAITFRLSDHDSRDEHFFFLFQVLFRVLELSQLVSATLANTGIAVIVGHTVAKGGQYEN
jgi:hypothetical protein